MVADQKNYGTNRRGFFLDVMEQCSEPGAQVAQKNKKGWLRKLAPVSGSYTEVYVMVEGTLMSITPKAAERFEPKYNVVSVQILAFDPVNDVYSFVIDTKHVGGGSNSAMTFKATTEALFSEWFSALYSNCYTVMNERALLDKSDACGRYASALAEGTRALDFTVGMLRYLREQFPRGIVDLFAYLEEEKRRKEDDSVFKPDSSERKKQKKWARLIQFMTQSPAIEATSGVMVNEGLEAILSLDLSYFPKCRGLRLSRLDFKKVIAGDQVRFLQLDQCRGSVDEFEGVARIIVNNCESFNFPSLYSQSGTLVELEIHSFLRKLEDFLAFPKTRIRILESGVSWRQLKILDVSRNELVSLPRELEQLTALESLKLDYNDIKKLDNFEGLKKLQVLSAKSNQLDNVAALVCCPSLTCVELSANYIEDFPWDYLPHITVLDLAHNRLTSWADVGAFSKSCPRLQILSLEGNPLEHAIQRSDYATLCRVLFNRKFKLDGNAVGPADKDTIEAIRVKYEDTVLYREAVPNTVLSDGPSARGTDVLTTLVEKSKPQRKRVVKVRRRRRLSMSSADGDALSAAGDAPPSEKPHKKRVKRRVAKKGSALGASMASATSFDDASHSDAQMEQPAGPSPLLSKPNLAALATAPNAEPAAKPGLLGAAAPPAAPAAAASGGAAVASGAAAPAAAKPAPPAAASGAAAPAAAKPAPPAAAAPAAAASGGVASAPGGAKPAPAAAAASGVASAAAEPPKPSHPIPTVAVTATGEMEAASQYDAGSTVNDEDDALAKTQAATNQPTRQAPVPGLSKSLGNVRDPQAAADGSKPSPRKRSSAQLSPRDSLDWSSKQASEGAGKKSPRGSLKAAADAGGKKDPRAAAPVQDAAAEAALEHALSGEYEGASFLDQIVNAPLPDLTSTAKRVAVSQEADAFDLPRGTFGMKDDSDHSSEFAFVPFDETVSGTHNEVVAPEKRSDPPLISDEVKAIVDAITAPAKGILYHIQHFLSMTYGWYMKYWHNIRKRDWAKLQMTLVILCQLHLLLVIPFAFVFIEISCTDCSPEDSYSDRKFRSFISWMVMLSSAFQTSFGLAAIFYENIVMLVAFNCLTFVLAARYIFNMVYYLADSNSAALVVVPPIFEISYMLVYLVVSCIVGQGFNRLMCYRVGGLPHIVRMYKMLQVFSALVKVDMLFIGLSAIVAGFWYITTTAGWIALFVSLPIALALFTLSIRWTKHEQRQPLIVFIIFALAVFGAQAYMIYRLYIHEDHTLRRKLDTGYHATVITLTAAAAVRVAMLISLLLCVRSFGRGLKEVLKDDNETTLFGFIPRVEI